MSRLFDGVDPMFAVDVAIWHDKHVVVSALKGRRTRVMVTFEAPRARELALAILRACDLVESDTDWTLTLDGAWDLEKRLDKRNRERARERVAAERGRSRRRGPKRSP